MSRVAKVKVLSKLTCMGQGTNGRQISTHCNSVYEDVRLLFTWCADLVGAIYF